MQKTNHTAVAILPPVDVWEPIQAIRERHDRQIRRWMPHINLLYPFVPPDRFDDVEPSLVRACAAVEPFSLTLAGFRQFHHGRGRYTIWLVPDPIEPLIELSSALVREMPDLDDQSRFEDGYTPHLSVGQVKGWAGVKQFLSRQRPRWKPVTFQIKEVCVISREDPPEDVFRLDRLLPIGAAAAADASNEGSPPRPRGAGDRVSDQGA